MRGVGGGLAIVWLGLALGFAMPAHASKEQAERYRLEQEMDRLAQRTTWPGVERVYANMLKLQMSLSTHTHYTAAQAAEARGDMLESWIRLERALREPAALEAPEPAEGISIRKTLPAEVDEANEVTMSARAALEQLRTRYGRVVIQVEKGRLPALVRVGEKPFSAAERNAIQRGQEVLADTLTYRGLLPIGRYMVDGEFFEVEPAGTHEISIAKR